MATAPPTTIGPLPPPPEPRYGIKDPLGPSDEVHRCLALYAKTTGNRKLGPREPIVEALAPLGYTADDLDKCVRDYAAIWNMYENETDGVAFTCLPKDKPPNYDMYMGVQ